MPLKDLPHQLGIPGYLDLGEVGSVGDVRVSHGSLSEPLDHELLFSCWRAFPPAHAGDLLGCFPPQCPWEVCSPHHRAVLPEAALSVSAASKVGAPRFLPPPKVDLLVGVENSETILRSKGTLKSESRPPPHTLPKS